MKKTLALLIGVLAMAAMACNLTAGDPTAPPSNNTVPIGGNQPTATTGSITFVTATPAPTTQVFATATQFQQAATQAAPPVSTSPPLLSGLSFSTSAGGNNMTTFPSGTQEVYARWNFSNVPIGTIMRRVWYRDGNVVVSRDEAWSNNWGTTGRLTHIKLFDYTVGLTPGNYYVVISLPSYNVMVDGNFSITAGAPSFSNISVSARSDGVAASTFPYGTSEVFVRFDFANITTGTVMQREWYRNNVAVVSRNETWSAAWGSTGRLTHISLFDKTSGYGLEPGDYRVVTYLRDLPSIKVETTFKIEANVGPQFSNLRFAPTPASPAATVFASGTKRVYAIWDYTFIPIGAQVRRLWERDNTVFVDRTEAWDFDTYGTNGTVTDVSIFDEINGLSSGTYKVTMSIVGQPGVLVTGTFTIQ